MQRTRQECARCAWGVACVLIALSVVGATTAAQRGVDRPGDLVAAGEYRFRFTNIGALHERADGALLVTDRSEKQLYLLADLTREPRALGRKGDGPQEFRSPHVLLETGGDTVILTDAQLPRWYIVNGGHVSDAPA